MVLLTIFSTLKYFTESSSGCEDMKEVVSVILSRKFKLQTRTVVEDIGMGLAAAKVAGVKCIVTKSRYTAEEDFQNAYANFDLFGNSPEERFYFEPAEAFCQTVTVCELNSFKAGPPSTKWW